MTDLYEHIRWANLLLAVTLTLVIAAGRAGAFARAPWPSKLGRLAVFGWITSTAYGTWEALDLQAAPGFRIPTTTSVLLLSGLWVFEEWRDDRRLLRRMSAVRQALRDSTPQDCPGG